MGNYNSQYESYYKSIVNNKANRNANYSERIIKEKTSGNPVMRRLIQDLSGVLVMLIAVILCKIITIPQTESVYNYSKKVVNTNAVIDYSKIITKVKKIKTTDDIQDEIIKLIDNMKVEITGGETIEEKIRSKFVLPASGETIEESEGIKINSFGDSHIIASYNGKVKECGTDKNLGNYVLIDHGEGIDTLYSSLDKILVKENDTVKKGDIIAENRAGDTKSCVHFEVLFMGQNEDLEKVIEQRNKG